VLRDAAPHVLEMVERGDVGVVAASNAVRGTGGKGELAVPAGTAARRCVGFCGALMTMAEIVAAGVDSICPACRRKPLPKLTECEEGDEPCPF
jgi:hypothetical protein